MNKMRVLLSLSLVLVASTAVVADDALQPDTFLIRRGTAELTVADFDARMSRLSPGEAASLARRPQQFSGLMDRLLLNRQLAQQARELGLDQNPNVAHDIQLAIEEVLSFHRLTHEVAGNEPNFDLLAQERYLANPEAYKDSGYNQVRHVLIRISDRSEEDAYQLAQNVWAQATAPDSDFDRLVQDYSEDPGKESNHGSYRVTGDGSFLPEFEQAAFALKEVGQISEPVRSEFGYHILILDEIEPFRTPSFEDVKESIIDDMRDQHISQARDTLRNTLRQLPEEADIDMLRLLPNRYGAKIPLPPADAE